jgi:transposase
VWVCHLRSGLLDHVPADLPDRVAPKLVEHSERIKNDSRVKAYYAKHGVTRMFGISKRGNRYVRRSLIHGARSCVTHLNRSRDHLGRWIGQLQSRMHVNKVTVAFATKIARIAWVILTRPGALYERREPAIA